MRKFGGLYQAREPNQSSRARGITAAAAAAAATATICVRSSRYYKMWWMMNIYIDTYVSCICILIKFAGCTSWGEEEEGAVDAAHVISRYHIYSYTLTTIATRTRLRASSSRHLQLLQPLHMVTYCTLAAETANNSHMQIHVGRPSVHFKDELV